MISYFWYFWVVDSFVAAIPALALAGRKRKCIRTFWAPSVAVVQFGLLLRCEGAGRVSAVPGASIQGSCFSLPLADQLAGSCFSEGCFCDDAFGLLGLAAVRMDDCVLRVLTTYWAANRDCIRLWALGPLAAPTLLMTYSPRMPLPHFSAHIRPKELNPRTQPTNEF